MSTISTQNSAPDYDAAIQAMRKVRGTHAPESRLTGEKPTQQTAEKAPGQIGVLTRRGFIGVLCAGMAWFATKVPVGIDVLATQMNQAEDRAEYQKRMAQVATELPAIREALATAENKGDITAMEGLLGRAHGVISVLSSWKIPSMEIAEAHSFIARIEERLGHTERADFHYGCAIDLVYKGSFNELTTECEQWAMARINLTTLSTPQIQREQ